MNTCKLSVWKTNRKMRKELDHFYIGASYGGNQDWFRSFMMRLGGCGAETACDSSLYFELHKGIKNIYPFDKSSLTRRDYVDFAHMMEPYLKPRMSGIDRLDIFIDGYSEYLRDCGVNCLEMNEFSGNEPYEKAVIALTDQIDKGYPVPTLILNHKDRMLKDYVWHWFLINGYNRPEGTDSVRVKAVTYSSYQWIDFRQLWDTGYQSKGGLVLFDLQS